MPEIGEVARVVHYIRKHLLNKTLTKVTAYNDDIVYGKVGTSAAEFEKHMTGKQVIDVGQQGKYFWMIMSSPPHPVMHLGMSGWFKIKSEHTYYYRKKDHEAPDEWPPKYAKFLVQAEGNGITEEAAFVDARRLGRIRLLNCDGKEIRKNSPLKENGPDPVVDKDLVSVEWLTEKCGKKKVPIKAMLLDQAVISGIGNWVGDEIMYNAKMHPEQYANTLQDTQIKQLHKSIHYVCGLACELLADSEQFPKDWLFKHRWSKAKKSVPVTLPNGNRIQFLTVGGRTSAVVPAVQKKTGPVAGDVGSDAADDSDAEVEEKPKPKPKPKKPKKSVGKKRKVDSDEDDISDAAEEEEAPLPPPKKAATKKAKTNAVKIEEKDEPNKAANNKDGSRKKRGKTVKEEEVKPEIAQNGRGKSRASTVPKASTTEVKDEDTGRRRSSRLRK